MSRNLLTKNGSSKRQYGKIRREHPWDTGAGIAEKPAEVTLEEEVAETNTKPQESPAPVEVKSEAKKKVSKKKKSKKKTTKKVRK